MSVSLGFLTSCYPYQLGEYFIENEVMHWDSAFDKGLKILVVPRRKANELSAMPNSFELEDELALKSRSLIRKALYLLRALFSKFFWRDVLTLNLDEQVLARVFSCLKVSASTLMYRDLLFPILKRRKIRTIYSYWNSSQAYAAVLLKREGHVDHVFSRAHRVDLYIEAHKEKYLPLKAQFINDFDSVYSISESGREYLIREFGAKPELVKISRLGVEIPSVSSRTSDPGCMQLLSISTCSRKKRIDKIIDALAIFCRENGDLEISWSHIGNGPEFATLNELAVEHLRAQNITFRFLGALPNPEVKKYFVENPVDMFLNASESEGVPVSIMEAMSFGVPVIAPDVGAISEVLDKGACHLLSPNFDNEEIVKALSLMKDKCKGSFARNKCVEKISEEYDRDENYKEFVRGMLKHTY